MKKKGRSLDPLKAEGFSSCKLIKLAKKCQGIVLDSTEIARKIARKLKHQIMNGVDCNFANLFDRYAPLEKEIQKLIYEASTHFCGKCSSSCCKEEICKESIESSFLSILVEKQRIRYDTQNGWISPSGCRLDYGRPLVCYEFFCEDILKSYLFKAANIQEIIKDFASVGNKAYGNTHLLCIDNLDIISSTKIEKMIYKISLVMNKMANFRFPADALKNGRGQNGGRTKVTAFNNC